MARFSSGLILTEQLTHAVSVDLKFRPSIGIMARKLDTLGANLRNFKQPLKESVKDVVIPSIRRNFDAGGRPKWVPLAAQTIKRKKGDRRPLIRTGNLRRQMGYLKIWDIDNEKAMITDLPQSIWYGKVHQGGVGAFEGFYDPVIRQHVNLGDDRAIPARPFVMLQKMDMIKINAVFNKWLAREIRAAGLS